VIRLAAETGTVCGICTCWMALISPHDGGAAWVKVSSLFLDLGKNTAGRPGCRYLNPQGKTDQGGSPHLVGDRSHGVALLDCGMPTFQCRLHLD
jgi:hypothetical protein